MNETDLPPLESDMLALIDGASGIESAPASTRLRLRDRIEAAIAGGGGAGGGGAIAAPAAPSAVARREGFRGSVRAVAPLAASFVLGAITSAAVLISLGVAGPVLRSDAVAASTIERVAGPPISGPAADGSASAVVEAAPVPSVASAYQPVPAASATTEPKLDRSGPRQEPQATRSQLALERRLLDQARAALERGEPAAALSFTTLHERQFPAGALAQEREAMAIRALVALGRTAEAHMRAARFRVRYPDSVLLSTIDEMTDEAGAR